MSVARGVFLRAALLAAAFYAGTLPSFAGLVSGNVFGHGSGIDLATGIVNPDFYATFSFDPTLDTSRVTTSTSDSISGQVALLSLSLSVDGEGTVSYVGSEPATFHMTKTVAGGLATIIFGLDQQFADSSGNHLLSLVFSVGSSDSTNVVDLAASLSWFSTVSGPGNGIGTGSFGFKDCSDLTFCTGAFAASINYLTISGGSPSPVPLPTAFPLFATALFGGLLMRRRRCS